MPEISNSESLYREIVTSMQEGVMVISMNGRITLLNPAAEKILGLTQEDVGSAYGSIFMTREGTDDFNEVIFDTIQEKGRVSNMPVDYQFGGQTKNLSLTTSYIRSNGVKSVVVVMSDMTELMELRDARTALDKITKLNAEYEKAKNEAVMANEAKSLFLSNMSHEIRTPINAVLGMNEMILRESSDEQVLTYAANIRSSGKTLLFLINDILDMSKIESGKMEIIRVEYEPAVLIMDLWNVIFLRAQEKDLSVRFSLDETLPRKLYGDDVRIKQIVTNLLTNAVKYTPQGGIEMHVAYVRHGEDQISLVISVKDTGMGIRKEDMGKLFESFQRLDEEKNRHIEGTGLGMNITMSLLGLMDGDMKVERRRLDLYGHDTAAHCMRRTYRQLRVREAQTGEERRGQAEEFCRAGRERAGGGRQRHESHGVPVALKAHPDPYRHGGFRQTVSGAGAERTFSYYFHGSYDAGDGRDRDASRDAEAEELSE